MSLFSNQWNDWKSLYAARSEPEYIRPLEELYWRGLIGGALIGVACIITWGIWVFIAVITTLGSAAPTAPSAPVLLDRNQLQTAVADFQARGTAFGATQSAPAPAPDPSK